MMLGWNFRKQELHPIIENNKLGSIESNEFIESVSSLLNKNVYIYRELHDLRINYRFEKITLFPCMSSR